MSVIDKKLNDLLNEEKWTRIAITNYTIKDFESLDSLVEEARNEGSLDEVFTICSEHLLHAKMSIRALYILSIISLINKSVDDSNQISLINIFIDNHKWQIVEHLCLKMLEYGDAQARFALRTLSEYYKESNDEKMYEIWERILKVDYEEADIAKLLAEKYEKEENVEKAIAYYKKAMYRYIGQKQFSGVKEIWGKLLILVPEDINFFYSIEEKISTVIEDKIKILPLLQDLYNYYKTKENWEVAVSILKIILTYDDKDEWTRTELVACLRQQYKDHSQLENCIISSDLTQSYRSVFDALAIFEKNIAFEVGNFVFHRTWGVGRISKIQGDELTIDFAKKRGHTMSLKMGISALKTLSKEHIWVLKATEKVRGGLTKKIKEDIKWALKTLILSFDNNCDLKKIKAEIVPSLLTQSEWTSWSTKARKMLNEDPMFDIHPNIADSYIVKTTETPMEEKLLNEFKAKKNFFTRVDIINKCQDKSSEAFMEMVKYFQTFLHATSQVSEQLISSYLLLNKIREEVPSIPMNTEINFAYLYGKIENVSLLYTLIKDKELKRLFLFKIHDVIPTWQEEFVKLFPTALSEDIINALLEDGKEKMLQDKVVECYKNYRVYKEACIWCFKNVKDAEWFSGTSLTFEDLIIILIHILDATYREIASRKDTIENRKYNKAIHDILFGKDALLFTFILEKDEERVGKLYTLISDIRDLEPTIKASLRSHILGKYKDFKFVDIDIEGKAAHIHGLMVTEKMLSEKKKELQEILTVLMPQNAKDLNYAMSLGDLRENAEYKAAKEEQSRLENVSKKLQEEIDKADVFDPTRYSADRVFFGTKVSLLNEKTNTEEEYTILGPWESDPSNGIISYMSPLGNSLLNKRVEEVATYLVNNEKMTYKVLKIEKIKI
ncbi:MAG: transcription elongation factor GreA [Treponema sp.]